MTFDFTSLTCPMPDCTEPLHLTMLSSRAFSVGDFAADKSSPTTYDADTCSWRVECVDGHVVLLPGPSGCPCDDQGGSDCPHSDQAGADAFDWSEDIRTFREHDADRLRALILQLGGNADGASK